MTNTGTKNEAYNWKKILVTIHSQPYYLQSGSGTKEYGKRFISSDVGNKDVDACCLEEIFKEQFQKDQFDVKYKTRCSYSDFITDCVQVMSNEKEKEKYQQYDCFFFVFLTFHNEDDERLHFDHKVKEQGLKPLEDIIEEVKKQEVTWGKPKIFLVQADDVSLIPKDKIEFKGGEEEHKKNVVKIPQDADRLIIKSTIPQEIANWDPKNECPYPKESKLKPSFLIQAFKSALEKTRNADQQDDFLSLTTTINGIMADLIKNCNHKRSSEMSVPLVTSTLTKLLEL